MDVSSWTPLEQDGHIFWLVDADCTLEEVIKSEPTGYRFTCEHPMEGFADITLSVSCLGMCAVPVELGETVHLRHTRIEEPIEDGFAKEQMWSVVHDESGALVFAGLVADSLAFPDQPMAFTPLSFETSAFGCGPDDLYCPGDRVPIVISGDDDLVQVFDKSSNLVKIDGITYDVEVELSCRVDAEYRAVLVVVGV